MAIIPPELNAQPVVVCALPRSGTTALNQSLANTQTFDSYGEIFHAKIDPNLFTDSESNFFSWLSRQDAKFVREVYSNTSASLERSGQYKLVCKYFEHLSSLTNKPFFILDIKYSSWHHFKRIWEHQRELPLLLKICKAWKIPIIHMVRENQVARLTSQIIAKHTNQWHNAENRGDQLSDKSISVDPSIIFARVKRYQAEVDLFRRYLRKYENNLELIYETTFVNESFSQESLANISTLVNCPIEISQVQTRLRRSIHRPEFVIQNKQSILEAFRGTQFEQMAQASFSDD